MAVGQYAGLARGLPPRDPVVSGYVHARFRVFPVNAGVQSAVFGRRSGIQHDRGTDLRGKRAKPFARVWRFPFGPKIVRRHHPALMHPAAGEHLACSKKVEDFMAVAGRGIELSGNKRIKGQIVKGVRPRGAPGGPGPACAFIKGAGKAYVGVANVGSVSIVRIEKIAIAGGDFQADALAAVHSLFKRGERPEEIRSLGFAPVPAAVDLALRGNETEVVIGFGNAESVAGKIISPLKALLQPRLLHVGTRAPDGS